MIRGLGLVNSATGFDSQARNAVLFGILSVSANADPAGVPSRWESLFADTLLEGASRLANSASLGSPKAKIKTTIAMDAAPSNTLAAPCAVRLTARIARSISRLERPLGSLREVLGARLCGLDVIPSLLRAAGAGCFATLQPAAGATVTRLQRSHDTPTGPGLGRYSISAPQFLHAMAGMSVPQYPAASGAEAPHARPEDFRWDERTLLCVASSSRCSR
jgi:hypothetical protein